MWNRAAGKAEGWGLPRSSKSPCFQSHCLLPLSVSHPWVLMVEPHQWCISPMVFMVEPHQGFLLSPTELIATALLPRNLSATKQQLTGGKAEARADSQSWGSRLAILYLSPLSLYWGSLCIDHTDPTSNTQALNLFEV